MIELPVAVRFQALPDVVDLSYVLTLSGFGGFVTALVGAGLRFEADRLTRLVLLGNVVGGLAGSLLVLLGDRRRRDRLRRPRRRPLVRAPASRRAPAVTQPVLP